ncbi:MAG: hypothetical protein HZY76_15420 [Anaerolineae bacterium]|nr:MAG: hypothetical protein HZY76_15420 [Anaerolineae bacterium]
MKPAYDPVNNKVYFNSGSTLYEWPVGGSIAALGTVTDPSGAAQAMVGLAFYNNVLYGIKNIANEAIYAIDTTTGWPPSSLTTRMVILTWGFAADPNTGTFYATNDDTTPFGSGLFRMNPDGTGTLIAPYPAGQTDIDGLAVSHDGKAYLVTDEPGFIYVWDFVAGAYATPLNNPWTTSEVFSAGAWIWETVTDPNIDVSPLSMSATQASNTTTSQTLNVGNTGTANLTWNIDEDPAPRPVTVPTGGSVTKLSAPPAAQRSAKELYDLLHAPNANVVADGGFEAGTPNPFWTEYSLNFGTVLCDAASCGTGAGTSYPRTGDWWAWFGGIAAYEAGSVSQSVTIPRVGRPP